MQTKDVLGISIQSCLRNLYAPGAGLRGGSVDKIERGRIWNHRNGQLEQDIFDRDLRIKELTAENAWLKKERIDQDKWWTQEMKDVNAENAKLKAQLAVSESIRNHSLRAENVKLENEKACHTMDLASRGTEIGMLKHSLAKCREALEKIANMEFGRDAYNNPIGCQECGGTEIAKEAMEETK